MYTYIHAEKVSSVVKQRDVCFRGTFAWLFCMSIKF